MMDDREENRVLQDGQISRLLDGRTSVVQAEVVNNYRTNFKRFRAACCDGSAWGTPGFREADIMGRLAEDIIADDILRRCCNELHAAVVHVASEAFHRSL